MKTVALSARHPRERGDPVHSLLGEAKTNLLISRESFLPLPQYQEINHSKT
jgi:hypothetical protein